MKKIIAVLLAILTLIPASLFTIPSNAALEEGEKVYELASVEVIDKYTQEAMALAEKITNSETNVEWTGIAYYISANGSDTNDGLTPDTAWRSVSKIADGSILAEGDAVLFERGGTYRFVETIQTKSGVTYSSYGSGAKPKLIGSVDASSAGSWEETEVKGVYKYKEAFTRDVGVIVFDMGIANGIKLIPLLDNGTVSNGFETFKSGGQPVDGPEDLKNDLEFWHDLRTGNLYLMSKEAAPSDRFVSIELVDYGHAMSGESKNVTVDNLDFFGFGSHCLGYGSGNNLRVQYCTFNFIGGSKQSTTDPDNTTRYGNAVEIYGSADGYVIDHCYARNVYDCCWTIQCGDGGHVFKNVEFSNNVAMYSNSGPEIWLGDSQGSGKENKMENVNIHNNYTLYSGYGWSHQRHTKDGNFLYGGRGQNDVEFINMNFSNNVGIFASDSLYRVNYGSEHGYNLNNNTYIQHNTKRFGDINEEPINGTGKQSFYGYTEANVTKFTEMGFEPGSKFWYVDGDYEVPKYDPNLMVFDDVNTDQWFYTNVKTAVTKGWFKGVSETEFSPDSGMTRAMLVTVLARLASLDTKTAEIPYKDVAKNAWFYPTVKWAYNAGIVDGGDAFRPDDKVTREELADMLYRYTLNQYKTKKITDPKLDFKDAADVTPAYASGIAYATQNGIISGYEDGTVKPKGGATRAEVATMMKRFADFYFELEADYSVISDKTDTVFLDGSAVLKAAPSGSATLINEDVNPTVHIVAGSSANANEKQFNVFERFANVNFAEYPYIKVRYKTDVTTGQLEVGIMKGGESSSASVKIENGEANSIIISYYDIMKPDGSVDMTLANGSLIFKPWVGYSTHHTPENSYFDIEYIACFPSLEEAQAFESDFEANSVLLTFMNGNEVYTSISARKGEKFSNSIVPAIEKNAYNFKGWSVAEGTPLNENTVIDAVFEKMLGVPVALFTPDNASAKASGGLAVETKTEDGITFFRFTVPEDKSSVDGTRANVTLNKADYDVSINKVMKVGYREKIVSADHAELNFIFANNKRLWTYFMKYGDEGKWNEAIIDLGAVQFTGGDGVQGGLSADEYRSIYVNGNMSPMFKPYQNNGLSMVTSDYFDVAYVAYFDSVEDAKAFDGFAAIKK